MSKIANNFACVFMIPFMICCKLVKLPVRQYDLIEQIIFHWTNRQYDYDLYYDIKAGDIEAGFIDPDVKVNDVKMTIYKCECCQRLIDADNNIGHCDWCEASR